VKTTDFDYELPPELIAQRPPAQRDGARMLVLDPGNGALRHQAIIDLPQLLDPGDLLVLNDTRVLPARLRGLREGGGDAEVLLLRPEADGKVWQALVRPSRRLDAGAVITFATSPLTATVIAKDGDTAQVRLGGTPNPLSEVRRVGQMPTPPYIKAALEDPERYQTIFSRAEGSAAAPTAGLHFTQALLDAIQGRGVEITCITLHVGLDTFRPVRVDDPARHHIHREWYQLAEDTAAAVRRTRQRGGRVIAVGTTCVRVLETAAEGNAVRPSEGWTELLILPGFRYRVVDALLTNFHLPKSTLLMLVSAFAGKDRVLSAYAEAVRLGYRFYSFGDCMFITGRAAP
jgi:S-adenosylmethionine:tRNA ribosyltransferase-isomerase